MTKSNKIEKIEVIAGKNVMSPSYKYRNLREMALTNLGKKFGMSGKLSRDSHEMICVYIIHF